MNYWERRGSQIYIEPDTDVPGAAKLFVDLHPTSPETVQTIVNQHNDDVDDARWFGQRERMRK